MNAYTESLIRQNRALYPHELRVVHGSAEDPSPALLKASCPGIEFARIAAPQQKYSMWWFRDRASLEAYDTYTATR